MGTLWIKKVLFTFFAWTIFLFIATVILLYVLFWTSPSLHDSLVNSLPLPQFIRELDKSLTLRWDSSTNWALWNLKLSNLENFTTLINLSSETTYVRNCKVIEAFDKDDLGLIQLACWIWNSIEYKSMKLMSLSFPKPWECGYFDSQDYLKTLLTKKYVRLSVYWQKDNIEYAYFYMGDLNVNNDILKKWYAFYIENWMKDKKLIDSIWQSGRGLEWIFKKCSVENPESIQGKQILTPN